MKEAVGSSQLFILVFTLILIFAGIMALTVNHSNAFAVKDQIVTIIEKNNGFDMLSEVDSSRADKVVIQEIVDSLRHNSYRQTGNCNMETNNKVQVVAYERNGKIKSDGRNASFCIYKIKGYNGPDTTDWNEWNGTVPSYYYQVVVFYKLDIPIINIFANFKEMGETRALTS